MNKPQRQLFLRVLDLPGAICARLPSFIGPEGRHQGHAEASEEPSAHGRRGLRGQEVARRALGEDEDDGANADQADELDARQEVHQKGALLHAEDVDGGQDRDQGDRDDLGLEARKIDEIGQVLRREADGQRGDRAGFDDQEQGPAEKEGDERTRRPRGDRYRCRRPGNRSRRARRWPGRRRSSGSPRRSRPPASSPESRRPWRPWRD